MAEDISVTPSTENGTHVDATLVPKEELPEQITSVLSPFDPESPLAALPVQLDVRVPVPDFRVENLLSLEKGRVLGTEWSHGEDLPVWYGKVQLMWTEFEVVDQKLAARVTRLA